MGYQGLIPGSRHTPIHTISHRMESLLGTAARMLVDDGADYMLEQVKLNTPVSIDPSVPGFVHIPGGDGIPLRSEIHRTPSSQTSRYIVSAKVGSNKSYANHVEEGTGLWGPKHAKYLIEPHVPWGWLAFPGKDGKMHFAKHVWHPGSPGQHMFMIGGRMIEMSMNTLAARANIYLWTRMRL